MRSRCGWLWLAWLACGCAAGAPDGPPAGGTRCERNADCNREEDGAVRSCGELRICVAGRCERGRDDAGSLLVVCDPADAGS